MTDVRVAFDIGPLHGPRSGIGYAVAAMHDALANRADIELIDYLTSFRARPAVGTRRMPLPAALAHRLWRHVDRPRVDRWVAPAGLVHGTNYVVPPSGLPRLVSVYDCWFLRNDDLAHPDVRRAGAVLRRAVRGGAVVHASSEATAAAVRELLPGADVHTVLLGPLPVPPPSVAVPVPELSGRPFVVAIGTLERRKNLPRLVAAFGTVAHSVPDVALVLAGRHGDDSHAVRAAVDALGSRVSDRVLFTGPIDDSVRSWLLHHAAVVAYPSLDEGFGFPVLDAMQAGTPLVASTAGSIPEVAGDAALLSAADDVGALADHLILALTDDSVRSRLRTAGDARWREFSWDRCAAGLADLYRQVAARPARATP